MISIIVVAGWRMPPVFQRETCRPGASDLFLRLSAQRRLSRMFGQAPMPDEGIDAHCSVSTR